MFTLFPKSLFQRFRRRLKATEPKSGSSKPTPGPVSSDSADRNVRPDKLTKRSTSGKQKLPKAGRRRRRNKQQSCWDLSQFSVSEVRDQIRFHDLGLPVEIMHAIADLGFQYCTPVQAEILPKALGGSDATGKAQTGTGKSAAFLINIFTQLHRRPIQRRRRPGTPRVLILAPTRELALQIEKDARAIGKYTNERIQSIFGGLGYESQKRALSKGIVDIIVATPGRLLDFHKQRLVHFSSIEILIIDEADRMLDMGFIPDVRKIVYSTPSKEKRQTMFFSATLTPEVERLARQWTRDPVHVEIAPEHVAPESVNQLVYIVTTEEKLALLINLIIGQKLERVLVFVNRRDQTNNLAEKIKKYGINCAILSGDVPQKKRLKTLDNFRNGKIRVLVATDVAARGLHIEDISHVINFTLPQDPEGYVHRIGRTGRAGASGISVSFACEADSFYIPAIEKFLGKSIRCTHPDETLLKLPQPEVKVFPRERKFPTKSIMKRRSRSGRINQKRKNNTR